MTQKCYSQLEAYGVDNSFPGEKHYKDYVFESLPLDNFSEENSGEEPEDADHDSGLEDEIEYVSYLIDALSNQITDLEEDICRMDDSIAWIDSGKPGLIDCVYDQASGQVELIVRELPGQEQILKHAREVEDKVWEIGDKWHKIEILERELASLTYDVDDIDDDDDE